MSDNSSAETAGRLPEGATIVHPHGTGSAVRTLFGYQTASRPHLDRVQNTISMVSAIVAAACVVAITILTITEVVTRVAFRNPLGWNVALIEQYLMMGTAFFGIVVAYRSGSHVAVATIFARFSGPIKKLTMLLVLLVVAAGFAYLLYSGAKAAAFSFVVGDRPLSGMAELPWPTWTWKSIVPVAALMGLIIVLIDLYRELTSPWSAPATDYDPGDAVESEI